MMAHSALAAGFADPVHDAQYNFRQCLTAMAEPGTIVRLAPPLELPQTPMPSAALALILTLADLDTPIWLGDDADLESYVRFHTGAPCIARSDQARFALLPAPEAALPLERWALGSDEAPHESTSLIMQVGALHADGPLSLTGPGIETMRRIGIEGVRSAFWRAWAARGRLFPRGVDLYLVADDSMIALPRTTIVTED